MKNLIIILIFIFIVFLPDVVKAKEIDCPYIEQVRLRDIAGAVSFNYELKEFEGAYYFDAYIIGLTEEIYLKDKDNDFNIRYNKNENKIVYSGLNPGFNYTFVFFASDKSTCPDYKIMSKIILVPYYNFYSTQPLCEGHEEYILCQKYVDIHSMVENLPDFIQKMNNYIASLEKEPKDDEPIIEEDEIVNSWDKIMNFMVNYYFYILITIIILGISGIVIIELNKRRSIL